MKLVKLKKSHCEYCDAEFEDVLKFFRPGAMILANYDAALARLNSYSNTRLSSSNEQEL